MKKHITQLIEAAVLLTVAWMTGCDSGKVENPSAKQSAAQTTALAVFPQETTAITMTETAAVIDSDSAETEEANDFVRYDTYDAFLAALGEQYPGVAMYTPPQILTQEWTLNNVMLRRPEDDFAYYEYDIVDAEQSNIKIIVAVELSYNSVEAEQMAVTERMELMAYRMEGNWEISETGKNWFLMQNRETGECRMYGMTGDENLYYCLAGTDSAGNFLDGIELQTLHEMMRL